MNPKKRREAVRIRPFADGTVIAITYIERGADARFPNRSIALSELP
jgi:hypothetical protein